MINPRAITQRTEVEIETAGANLTGDITVPEDALGLVLFAHGSGSSRYSPRNRYVADRLNAVGMATVLVDLLTVDEEMVDRRTAHLRFDIGLLSDRLTGTIDWLATEPRTRDLPVGLFGASTGAAAAIISAVARQDRVWSVVSRGGRPDLAGAALEELVAPTLLIVGENDRTVIDLNRRAANRMQAAHQVEIVPNAGHLFAEPGALQKVAELACKWFTQHLHDRPVRKDLC